MEPAALLHRHHNEKKQTVPDDTDVCSSRDIIVLLVSLENTSSLCFFFFSSRRRHTRLQGDWSSDVCSSDLGGHRANFKRFRRKLARWPPSWGSTTKAWSGRVPKRHRCRASKP